MAWFWWWGSGGTPPPPDPQALLNEAAVRFDFSEYDDINDMVDVNGGWGPLVPDFAGVDTIEFTADGLRVANDGAIGTTLGLSESPSPVTFGPDGISMLCVLNINIPVQSANLGTLDIACDTANEFVPEFNLAPWVEYTDQGGNATIGLWDVPGEPPLVSFWSIPTDFLPADFTGRCISICVADVSAQTLRVRLVRPGEDIIDGMPFAQPAVFAGDPRVADGIFFYLFASALATDLTLIEGSAWNRALSTAEVDALVTHFQA